MKYFFFRGILVLVVGVLLNVSSLARADDDPSGGGGLSDATKAGIGCLVASGGVLAAVFAAGPTEQLMISAGGLLVPSATTPLMMGLMATVIGATCSVGIAATPFVLWFSEQVGTVFGGLWGSHDAPAVAVQSPN